MEEGCCVCWRGLVLQHSSSADRASCSHLPRQLRGSSRQLCCTGSRSKALKAPSLAQEAVSLTGPHPCAPALDQVLPQTSTTTHCGTLQPRSLPGPQAPLEEGDTISLLCRSDAPGAPRMLQPSTGGQPALQRCLQEAGQAGCGVSVPGTLGLGSERMKNPQHSAFLTLPR